MATTLGNVLIFFQKIGIYDVVLPFLLVFTIMFSILEKTRVLGVEKVEGKDYTKKNLNAMAAFVIAFFVIASGRLVEAITSISANVVVLLLLSVFFLMLVGTFFKEKEGAFLEGRWKTLFMVVMFIGIVIVFLDAIKTESGKSWLEAAWWYVTTNWSSTGVAAIILIVVIILFMYYIVHEPAEKKKEKKEGE